MKFAYMPLPVRQTTPGAAAKTRHRPIVPIHILPDWVLAEHGGPFEFSAEDFRRRVQWGQAAAKAADPLCLSGNHQHDWNLHRVRIEPLVHQAQPGGKVKATLVASNVLPRKEKVELVLTRQQGFNVPIPSSGPLSSSAGWENENAVRKENPGPSSRQPLDSRPLARPENFSKNLLRPLTKPTGFWYGDDREREGTMPSTSDGETLAANQVVRSHRICPPEVYLSTAVDISNPWGVCSSFRLRHLHILVEMTVNHSSDALMRHCER